MIALGNYHSCVLLSNGKVVCWGFNAYGQLGIGDTTNVGILPGQMGSNLVSVSLPEGRRL